MSAAYDQDALPATVTESALITAVGAQSSAYERTAALKELIRRRSVRVGSLLVDVIDDVSAPIELRTTASIALGRRATEENQDALLRALASDHPALVARAAQGLGRIGDRRALEALERLTGATGGMAAGTIGIARTLISCRLGLTCHRLPTPAASDELRINRERAHPVSFDALEPGAIRAAAHLLRQELPAIPVAERGALRFCCRSEHLWIMLCETAAGAQATARMEASNAVAAVVLKESTCPGGVSLFEYILSHPVDERKAQAFGVRPSGVLCHFGEIDLNGADARLRLRSLDTPHVLAMELEVIYRGSDGTMVIRDALCEPSSFDRKRRPEIPRRYTAGTPLRP